MLPSNTWGPSIIGQYESLENGWCLLYRFLYIFLFNSVRLSVNYILLQKCIHFLLFHDFSPVSLSVITLHYFLTNWSLLTFTANPTALRTRRWMTREEGDVVKGTWAPPLTSGRRTATDQTSSWSMWMMRGASSTPRRHSGEMVNDTQKHSVMRRKPEKKIGKIVKRSSCSYFFNTITITIQSISIIQSKLHLHSLSLPSQQIPLPQVPREGLG